MFRRKKEKGGNERGRESGGERGRERAGGRERGREGGRERKGVTIASTVTNCQVAYNLRLMICIVIYTFPSSTKLFMRNLYPGYCLLCSDTIPIPRSISSKKAAEKDLLVSLFAHTMYMYT